MITVTLRVVPPYSVVLLLDPTKGIVPPTMGGELIATTDSCIAVGCRAEDDGPTSLMLGSADALDPGYRPVFEGRLETPSKFIAVQSVVGSTFLQLPLQTTTAAIKIWANDPREPDEIRIGVIE